MVKLYGLILICLLTHFGWSQNISFGTGIDAQATQVGFVKVFGFDILNNVGDTLRLTATDVQLSPIYAIPIYIRYEAKKNWWFQLDYSFEKWRIDLNGITEHTPTYISIRSKIKLDKAWKAYKNNIGQNNVTPADSLEFYSARNKNIYKTNESELTRKEFNSYEEVQYSKISLGFGSSFNNRGKVKMFYGLGVNFIVSSTAESYQGFNYDNLNVKFHNKIMEKLPKLETSLVAPFAMFGIEKQNLRLGFDFQFYKNPASTSIDDIGTGYIVDNSFDDQTLRYIFNYGIHVNYTIFNQYFDNKDFDKKGMVLDPQIVGQYNEKPKFLRFGISANFPSFYNSGESVISQFDIDDTTHLFMNQVLENKNDNYLTGVLVEEEDYKDKIYLEKRINDIFVNDNGLIDTNVSYQTLYLEWGSINTIIRSPKLAGFISVNPHRLFSLDMIAGYQKLTLGIVAYESERYFRDQAIITTVRKLLYQEEFNELSLGLNLNVHKNISNTSKLGLHFGMNLNTWLRSKFKVEAGGVNDSELLQDFHQYFINGTNEGNWNQNNNSEANRGVFSKQDYVLHKYKPNSSVGQQDSYHTDFSNYLFNTWKKRMTAEIRVGADYYIDNFKFTIYGEKSILRPNLLYSNLISVGFGVAMYLN